MYMPLDMVQLSLIFARGPGEGRIASRVAGEVSRRRRRGPARSAGRVSQRGQSLGGAQKESARAAVSNLFTAAVVVAALMAVFCV